MVRVEGTVSQHWDLEEYCKHVGFPRRGGMRESIEEF
jgi:hypothetical protein